MNEGLFQKYTKQLSSYKDNKQKIIIALQEKIGVIISDSEITLKGKEVILSTSSVKKATLLQKGGKEIIKELGYSFKI